MKRYVCPLLSVAAVILVLSVLWSVLKDRNHKSVPVHDYPAIVERGVLRVTTEYNASGYYVTGDTLAGFHYELVQAFAQAHNLDVEVFPEMSLNTRISGVQSGKYDLLASGIIRTVQPIEHLTLTHPIFKSKQVLVQRNKANLADTALFVNNLLELAGKTVYTVKDDPSVMRIYNLGAEIGDTIYVVEIDKYGPEQLITMVAYGDINYAVCSEHILSHVQDSLPQLSDPLDVGFTQLSSWAVNSGSVQLLDSLNVWIDAFKKTPQYRKLYRKYYGGKAPF